jgi:hypothetical protein
MRRREAEGGFQLVQGVAGFEHNDVDELAQIAAVALIQLGQAQR